MAKQTRSRDKSFSQEEWRGVIVVVFKKGTPAEVMHRLVKAQGCTLQEGHEGSLHVKVVVIPKGQKDEDYLKRFGKLDQVAFVSLNSEEVTVP